MSQRRDGEGIIARFTRKASRDPLVPAGCLLTAGVLGGGLYTLYTGQAGLSQKFMRARIVAQGATVVALITGSILMGSDGFSREKRETLEEKLLRERRERR